MNLVVYLVMVLVTVLVNQLDGQISSPSPTCTYTGAGLMVVSRKRLQIDIRVSKGTPTPGFVPVTYRAHLSGVHLPPARTRETNKEE